MKRVTLSFMNDEDLGLIKLALYNLVEEHDEMSIEDGDDWTQAASRGAQLIERVDAARRRLEGP